MTYRLWLLFATFLFPAHVIGLHLSNLNNDCYRCMCEAANGCSYTGCANGYCGPFYISQDYWADANKIVLPGDDPKRGGAFQDCARDNACAKRIIERYMLKFGRDCNSDRVTNCEDYYLVHYNGGPQCEKSLKGTDNYNRFMKCHKAK